MNDITAAISKSIKENRERLGIQQKELAEMIGAKQSTVSNWEQCANAPGADTLVRLCEIFNVSLDEMYGINKKSSPPVWEDEQAELNITLFKSLSREQQQDAIRYMQFLLQSKERDE
jgi:transcriptional regulator with XRE-family HTH domain